MAKQDEWCVCFFFLRERKLKGRLIWTTTNVYRERKFLERES